MDLKLVTFLYVSFIYHLILCTKLMNLSKHDSPGALRSFFRGACDHCFWLKICGVGGGWEGTHQTKYDTIHLIVD